MCTWVSPMQTPFSSSSLLVEKLIAREPLEQNQKPRVTMTPDIVLVVQATIPLYLNTGGSARRRNQDPWTVPGKAIGQVRSGTHPGSPVRSSRR